MFTRSILTRYFMVATIYLIRHATPDWSRTDLRYDIPPGPPLTPKGEAEAQAVGEFLRELGIARLYASPLDRTTRTAELAGEALGLQPIIDPEIAEWRHGEADQAVRARSRARVDAALDESIALGPVGLVTHGGPIRLLLAELGLAQAEVDFYRRQFDRDNPAPPAGVWRIRRNAQGELDKPELVFTPEPHQKYTPTVVYV
jgi:broad specificity phosphatase PhoE